ncbi:hypothetical protein B5E60_10510 [Alistipes sp. An116]|uniref:hypothetical protein n=1 Tax=Alistipes sp. An116 TaxID=1965546 RepID=UPI000B3912A4|nr:hypothetical protein [Alistipes sp. An116]OUQ52798.1 hypothetical protein B5E60_10510 [Alistipes sp. An116]
MKKFLCVAIAFVCTTALQAQETEKDVTEFLGIPVDGYKPAMIEKLKAKGFRYIPNEDLLEGEFNGTEVYVGVATNNNKVYRIGLIDKNNQNKTDIRIRFNLLCRQFENNPRYTSLSEDQTIPEDEDFAFEMAFRNKRYEAIFYQNLLTDSLSLARRAQFITKKVQSDLLHKYTQEQIDNPSEEIQSEIFNLTAEYTADMLTKKSVWFMILEHAREYYICMFYDNEYNKANGEDL